MKFFNFKKEPKFNEDDLINPQIGKELINSVVLDGDFENLEILAKNTKFKNIDPELILSMSKITEPIWIKQTKNQLLITLITLVLGLFIFKFYNWINSCVFILFLYLYFIKQKKEMTKELELESFRKKYILDIMENTNLKELDLNINFEESHTHKL